MAKEKFEDALAKLEEIVKKMESGDLSLEDSLKSFEEGIRLVRVCSRKLDEAQRRVELLLQEEGETVAKPYREENSED
ncbi:MAG TPA: exodeoxyribonuclease VII small subunit [Syntrophales bacterium]|nr:exodeoxyribonuclease VII small subunit [Syntrophales bacterium]